MTGRGILTAATMVKVFFDASLESVTQLCGCWKITLSWTGKDAPLLSNVSVDPSARVMITLKLDIEVEVGI